MFLIEFLPPDLLSFDQRCETNFWHLYEPTEPFKSGSNKRQSIRTRERFRAKISRAVRIQRDERKYLHHSLPSLAFSAHDGTGIHWCQSVTHWLANAQYPPVSVLGIWEPTTVIDHLPTYCLVCCILFNQKAFPHYSHQKPFPSPPSEAMHSHYTTSSSATAIVHFLPHWSLNSIFLLSRWNVD